MKRFGLWGGGVLVVLLVASQFLLPPIAERVARSRAARHGHVESVEISAFPALELLWGGGGSARIDLRDFTATPTEAVDLLWSARGFERLDVTVGSLRVEPLRIARATVARRGRSVSLQGTLDEGDLRAALPAGVELEGLTSRDGQLEIRVGGSLFGASVTLGALLVAREGRLLLEPQGLGLGGLVRPVLFSDPRLAVEAVSFEPLPGAGPASWRLSLRGSLRGG